MLPWNFLISINAFWNYKFRQVDNDTTEINQTTLAFMENSVSTSIWIILRNSRYVLKMYALDWKGYAWTEKHFR